MSNSDRLLEVKELKTHFFTDEGIVKAVDGVTFEIRRGKTLCIVGESGCGKSVSARSILQIVDPPGRIVAGQVLYHRCKTTHGDSPAANGHSRADDKGITEVLDLAAMDPHGKAIRDIRGKEISMIFQEPMTSLSPVHTIGNQMIEGIMLHLSVTQSEARALSVTMLRRVGIPKPEQRIDSYPFQLSGGMRQRAMIAMALACHPSLLIADEPTTALDVTTQAQILDLMRTFKDELGMSLMLITHDLGVVAEMADDVAVMYLGHVVERGSVDAIFHDPKHPYTQALLRSIPKVGPKARNRLASIRGMVPGPYTRPTGCYFHPRCDRAMVGLCDRVVPQSTPIDSDRVVRCLLYEEPYVKNEK